MNTEHVPTLHTHLIGEAMGCGFKSVACVGGVVSGSA